MLINIFHASLKTDRKHFGNVAGFRLVTIRYAELPCEWLSEISLDYRNFFKEQVSMVDSVRYKDTL